MKPFERIVITGDLMRPFPSGDGWVSATSKNIRWLRHVFNPALQATGLPISMLAWDERMERQEGRFFDTPVVAPGCPSVSWGWLKAQPPTCTPGPPGPSAYPFTPASSMPSPAQSKARLSSAMKCRQP